MKADDEIYDVVIIGSGLGGLYSARLLAMHGYKVCVLEKNRQIGGNLQTFARDKCVFDTGVHYLGGLDKGQNLYQFFKYAGIIDKLKLKRMDADAFDVITFYGDDNEYPHGMGYDNFKAGLFKFFPEEKENIDRYCDAIQHICTLFPIYNLSAESKDTVINEYFSISAKEFIESFTNNKKLQDVLGGSNLLYAGYADKSPAYQHALIVNSYIQSAWRCVNGGSQIALALTKLIKEAGSVVKKYAEISRLHYEDGEIKHAELKNGSKVFGKQFISNVHPQKTLELLDPGTFRKSYENRINNIENGISIFSLHLVMKPETFLFLNKNFYYLKGPDSWTSIDYKTENWPESYLLLTPVTHRTQEYAESIAIMAYMRFEEVEQWKDTFNTEENENIRDEAYQAFRTEKAERLLDEVEIKFPGIRDKIQSYHVSTPLSYRDYINTPDGSMYGFQRDYNNPLKSYLSPRTKIHNLLLTGQNLNMHGVLGVTVGAVITCSQILDGKKLVDDIRNA